MSLEEETFVGKLKLGSSFAAGPPYAPTSFRNPPSDGPKAVPGNDGFSLSLNADAVSPASIQSEVLFKWYEESENSGSLAIFPVPLNPPWISQYKTVTLPEF